MVATQTPAYQGDDPRFVRAARHSRRVRWMRRAVPAVVVLSLALIVGASVFNPFRLLKKLPIDLSKLSVSGTKITMEAPHLAGFLPDSRDAGCHRPDQGGDAQLPRAGGDAVQVYSAGGRAERPFRYQVASARSHQ